VAPLGHQAAVSAPDDELAVLFDESDELLFDASDEGLAESDELLDESEESDELDDFEDDDFDDEPERLSVL